MKIIIRKVLTVFWTLILALSVIGFVRLGPAITTVIHYREEIESWAPCHKDDPEQCNRARKYMPTAAYKAWQECMYFYQSTWFCGSPVEVVKSDGVLPDIASWQLWSWLQETTRRQ